MNPLFTMLSLEGIFDPISAEDLISKLNKKEILRIGRSLNSIIEQSVHLNNSIDSQFIFSSGITLSGGRYPCSAMECRLVNMRGLSSFAALYADRVFIPNFFSYLHHHNEEDIIDEEALTFLKRKLIADLTVLFNWEPLITASIVQFGSEKTSFCPDCRERLMSENGVDKNANTPTKQLREKMLKEIKFSLLPSGKLLIRSGSGYIGAESIYKFIIPPNLKSLITKDGRALSSKEIEESKLLEKTIYGPFIDNLLSQKYLISHLRPMYIANTPLEVDIMHSLNRKKELKKSEEMVEGLDHQLPIPVGLHMNVGILRKLVEFRKSEEDAFLGYRYAFRDILRDSSLENESDYRTAVSEAVLPKINEVARIINSHQGQSLLGDVLFTGATFSAGMMDYGALTQFALGVAGAGIDNLRRNLKSKREIPVEAKSHQFFFLWKAHKIMNTNRF